MSFPTSEHLIMAFKEHLLVDTPLSAVLKAHEKEATAESSKKLAGSTHGVSKTTIGGQSMNLMFLSVSQLAI